MRQASEVGFRPRAATRVARTFVAYAFVTWGVSLLSFVWFLSHHPTSSADLEHFDQSNAPVSISKVKVFYNLFIKDAKDDLKVRAIIEEQFKCMDPTLHDYHVDVTSIGHQPSDLPPNALIREHRETGQEDLTLHALWEYCRRNGNTKAKVAYLHSKGSIHERDGMNTYLRRFLTRGALSKECARMPNDCDVCSSRFSPLPHPHTPGNMWVAQCKYISELVDPSVLREGGLHPAVSDPPDGEIQPCRGRGRFFFEHWVHSHPTVRPCDLYPGSEYRWGYINIPRDDEAQCDAEIAENTSFGWTPELKRAPRFDFGIYTLRGGCSGEQIPQNFLSLRKEQYGFLYNVTELDESWWGWELLRQSGLDEKLNIK